MEKCVMNIGHGFGLQFPEGEDVTRLKINRIEIEMEREERIASTRTSTMTAKIVYLEKKAS